MKSGFSFGFPTLTTTQENKYRADTSSHKKQLINALTRSEKLWEEGRQAQSLVLLRKVITLIEFILDNQSISNVKDTYEQKHKQLQNRLRQRQDQYQTSENSNKKAYNQNKSPSRNNKNLAPRNGGGHRRTHSANTALKGQVSEAIVTQKPNVKWEDVSGLQNAKNSLKQAVILPIRFPQIFTGSRKPWKGILLYGPPGTGKTFLAKACATEADGTFFSVSSSDLMSKYVGESERLIKQLFNLARERKPSIIFIDQIDSMCGNRSDGQNQSSRRVKTQFFVQMQGVGHDDTGVLVLGATNLPWALDPAIRRRFERRIYIPLPDYPARLAMVKRNMSKTPNSLKQEDFEWLAKQSQHFSGSDIANLVKDAVYEPVRRLQSAKMFKKINGKYSPCREGEQGQPASWTDFKNNEVDIGLIYRQDFIDALKRTKPTVDQKQLKQYVQFTNSFGQQG